MVQSKLNTTYFSTKDKFAYIDHAKKAWEKKFEKGGYVVVESDSQLVDVRVAISYLLAADGMYKTPKIISVWGGDKVSVENIDEDTINILKSGIFGDTFTFGTGTCWAVNNRGTDTKVTLDDIYKVLGII